MCGSDIDRPVGLTIVITAGVAFGVVIGSLALDFIRSSSKKTGQKPKKKCKRVHVKQDNVYQQPPPLQQQQQQQQQLWTQ